MCMNTCTVLVSSSTHLSQHPKGLRYTAAFGSGTHVVGGGSPEDIQESSANRKVMLVCLPVIAKDYRATCEQAAICGTSSCPDL